MTDKQGCERVTRNRKRQRERSVPAKSGLDKEGHASLSAAKTPSAKEILNYKFYLSTNRRQSRRLLVQDEYQ